MGRRRAALEGPAARLSRSLRDDGHAAAGRWLGEMIPDGPIASDEHRGELAAQLAALAANSELPDGHRAEASRLAVVAADLAPAIGRAGTVWIAWCEPSPRARAHGSNEPGRYELSWQSSDDDEDLYEDGPPCPSLDEALAWAHARSDAVIVRPAWDPGIHYWAGRSTPAAGLRRLTRPTIGPNE